MTADTLKLAQALPRAGDSSEIAEGTAAALASVQSSRAFTVDDSATLPLAR